MPQTLTPHQRISVHGEKEQFLVELFDSLWERYRSRMEFVRQYEAMIQHHGAAFINDHIAFRTLAMQKPAGGIFMISRLFEALGYSAANCYEFPDKHLNSIHYQHPNPQFPKLFVTQLKVWELSARSRELIHHSVKTHRPPLTEIFLNQLHEIDRTSSDQKKDFLKTAVAYFAELPWNVPQKKNVIELDKESQFGAWVLVNGYDVNHFTASVNSHGVPSLDDIEKVVAAMKEAGIPMKKEIEGERGTKLRQTSTDAAVIDVAVKDGVRKIKISWTYAYFEIAERPLLKNPVTGQMERFEGFLGGQATHLFEMTKLKK